jgi:uncharacterized protein (TIGR03086 family)
VALLTPVAALRLADREFSARLELVPNSSWDDQSACDDWSVGDLVDHVIGGNVFTMGILGGSAADAAMEAAIAGAIAGSSRRRDAYRESAREMLQRLTADGALDQSCHHVAGTLSGAEVAAIRTEDVALHAWDLAVSTGADEALDPALVEYVWGRMSLRADELAASGRYGTRTGGGSEGDLTVQERLLDITGRAGRSLR